MILMHSLLNAKILLEFNLILIIFILILNILLNFLNFKNLNLNLINKNIINIIKYIILISFLISFLIHIIACFFYIDNVISKQPLRVYCIRNSLNTLNVFTYDFTAPDSLFNFKLNLSFDFFGLVLLSLAYIVGFISILVLDTRLNLNNFKYLYYFNIFLLIVYIYTSTTNIILFFMFYELLLIPSFLIIYYLSNSRRSIQASLYFIMWTQLGSFLVLISISYIIYISGIKNINDLIIFKFTLNETYFVFILIFFGFGFKVPIWPFHYWLTKTHVEAPSGFSIYLSGFLVKSALYGFYKILMLINLNINTSFFVMICFLGVIDSSLKMWGQTDLKKLVAYGTIQEMNLIYLSLMFGDNYLIYVTIIFTITHAFLSSLMFFLVDCIYRRFNSRSIIEINGILHILPNLSIFIILMIVFFSGIPTTSKFISEFCLFSFVINILPISSIFLLIISNVLGLIGFSKVWFNSIFGSIKKNSNKFSLDLSIKEILVISLNLIFLILPSLLYFYIF